MEELIKVDYKGDKALVSARELHEFLEIKTRFSLWMEQYLKTDNKYGFEDGVDFTSVVATTVVNNGAKRELQDYALTSDMAKEVSMITGSEKGKQARKYFIECEKTLRTVLSKQLPSTYLEALKELVALEEQKALMQPKVEYHDKVLNPTEYTKLLTSTQVAKDLGMTANKLHLLLHEMGVIYKQGKTWILYAKYEHLITDGFADYVINEHSQTLKWSEKGRKFIIELLESNK